MSHSAGILGVIWATFLLGASSAGSALAQPDALTSFAGRWVWAGHVDKHGQDQACKDHWQDYEISADRRDIRTSYITDDGTIKKHGYRVLYSEQNTAVMYLEDEDRRLKSGDRLIWVLIMETPNRFRWRIYGVTSNPAAEAEYARVRCR